MADTLIRYSHVMIYKTILQIVIALGAFTILGIGLIVMSIFLLKRAKSPFIKVYYDCIEIFHDNWKIVFFPLLTIGALCVLVALIFHFGGLLEPLLPQSHTPSRNPLLEAAAIGIVGLGAIIGTCIFVLINSPLIHYLVARAERESESLTQAVWQTLPSFWAILSFTVFWSGFLVIIALVGMKLNRWLRSHGFWRIDILLTVAEWALDKGVTMAAYFMLATMIREEIGPWKALLITAEITKEEFGKTFPEVMRLEMIDSAIAIISGVIFFAWIGIVIMTIIYSHSHPLVQNVFRAMHSGMIFFLFLGVPICAVLLIHISYFVVLQTLQLILATAVYLYLKDGIMMEGFNQNDFDQALGLRARGIREIAGLNGLM